MAFRCSALARSSYAACQCLQITGMSWLVMQAHCSCVIEFARDTLTDNIADTESDTALDTLLCELQCMQLCG
jgi:hypothetical protein